MKHPNPTLAKRAALVLLEAGWSWPDIARALNVPMATIHRWVNRKPRKTT